ncbi:hypothetical protein [Kingella potus]|uniref:hypothetical protein n=1 Tax=Kingella potus TaxID=265175 RepID=UPI001FD06E75|nr:hypothetical protein [Kingella potus]UOP01367.1 hypothetical protein LVJ84_03785 [Kingella potus]
MSPRRRTRFKRFVYSTRFTLCGYRGRLNIQAVCAAVLHTSHRPSARKQVKRPSENPKYCFQTA